MPNIRLTWQHTRRSSERRVGLAYERVKPAHLLELCALVARICHLHIRLREQGAGIVRLARGPHVDQVSAGRFRRRV